MFRVCEAKPSNQANANLHLVSYISITDSQYIRRRAACAEETLVAAQVYDLDTPTSTPEQT